MVDNRVCPYYGLLKLKKTYKVPVWGFVIFCKINVPPLEEILPQPTDLICAGKAVPHSVDMRQMLSAKLGSISVSKY